MTSYKPASYNFLDIPVSQNKILLNIINLGARFPFPNPANSPKLKPAQVKLKTHARSYGCVYFTWLNRSPHGRTPSTVPYYAVLLTA